MKTRPKKKLSINKETIRRLSPEELSVVRGGDATLPADTTSELCLDGTLRECLL